MNEQRKLIRLAWERGKLDYKLRPHQRILYTFIWALFIGWNPGDERESLRKVLNCARRFGKTFVVCLIICELCIRIPGFIVRYAAPTEKQLRKIIKPNMRVILKDCPKDLRPEWNVADSAYYFKNGSEWHLAGTDKDNVEKLRGSGCDLGVADEAGFMTNMGYVVDDVLMPQTLDRNGAMVIISTPPKTPGHEFASLCMDAMKDGDYLVQTIRENTFLSERTKEKLCKTSGGPDSTTWRREYLCEFVVDQKMAVLPEFDAALQMKLVKEWPRPTHFHPLTAMDVGYHDSTFILFGYYDFLNAKAIIEREVVISRARTDQIATAVKEKEAELGYPKLPFYMRKTDVDHRLIADMAHLYGVYFSPTSKDEIEAQVNMTREWLKNERIIVNPACTNLIAQMRSAIWNKSRSEFDRVGDFGHFDGVAALNYFIRNLLVTRNPFPAWPPGVTPLTHFIPPGFGERRDENLRVLEDAFTSNIWRN